MKTNIIIPVHNQWNLLENCIDSIYKKTNNNFNIIVVNDGSDEETTFYCEKLLKNKKIHKLIHNLESTGFSNSCNQGIIYSGKCDYYCFLNSDTLIITENWLEKFINISEEDSKIGCIGVLSNNATMQSIGKKNLNKNEIENYGNWIVSLSENKLPETTFINGFCFFIKSNIIEEIGLFDCKVFPHYGSEDDYILRIREKGYKLIIADNIYIYHYSNQSYKSKRNEIIKSSSSNLLNKWGNEKIKKDSIFSYKVLEYLREKVSKNIFKNDIEKKLEFPLKSEKSKSCEIIIVVHNSLNTFKKCIESILRNTKNNYSLTIIENNCNEECKSYIKSLKNVKVIKNNKNLGFGYCNNKAIRESKSNYICFLNSDTIVTPNWLTNLIKNLEQENIGFVGPVSNSVSSEFQLINYTYSGDYDSVQNINSFSEKNFILNKEKRTETNRLIGFCLLTKKSVLEKIGVFDERFEFNFEDDDLCLRAIEKGFKLYSILDVFIFHYGSTTFKQLSEKNKTNEYLEKSRSLFQEKWYDSNRVEKINNKKNDLSIIFLLASDSPCGGVKIVFEYANRLKDRGYNVKIYCENQYHQKWFNLFVPIYYYKEITEIPECDIAIGTYFTTLKNLQEVKSTLKIHFCQGYEALIYDEKKSVEKNLIKSIEDNYTKIKDKIVISSWLKEMLDPKYNIDCKLIQNGIDPYVFSLKKHGRNRIPRILIVGNYNLEIKGVKKTLELLRQIPEKQIVRMASEKCKFDEAYEFHNMAKMSQEDIAKVYESCDITICASHKVEGFSLPPLESMASGTPVITTDSGGVNEYAIHNWNSIIIPQDNNTLFLHWIKQLLNNNIIYNRLVENGLKTANNFLWYSKIDALEEHLQSLYQKQIEEQKNSLSVCMIVKNEEENLERCLKSIESISSEIIIVDTGSTDQTISIAKKFGAKIYHFEWNNNFSDARNFALSKVTQKWVLIIDADESISSKDLEKINSLLKGPQNAYSFVTRNYVKFLNIEGVIPCQGEYEEEGDNPGWCSSEKVRLFPWSDKIKFEGEVHELVEKSLDNEKIEIKDTEVQIHHWGYLKEKGKQEVYLELGKKKLENLEEPKSLYELGTQYMALNNFDEALVIWRKLLLKEPKNIIYMSRMGTTYNLLGDYKQAEKFFKEVLIIKEDEYTLKHLGICYAKQGKVQEAYKCFKKIVYTTEDLKTMADFAYCCNFLKRFDESIGVLEKSLKINKLETVRWGLLEIAYNEKGLELAKKNRFVQAIHMFKSALYINPSFDVARNNLNQIKKILDKNKRFL